MRDIIETTLNYIDEHLDEEMSVDNLANQVNYSVYYFQRMFSVLTGYGVKEYIRERRLTRAAFDLIHGTSRITDIALRCGFESPEAFTKAFKKRYHETPSEFKVNQSSFKATPPLQTLQYGKKEKKMKVRIEKVNELKIVGKKHIVSLENQQNLIEIPKLWDNLNSSGEDEKLFALNNGQVKGIAGVCKKVSSTQIEYWIGVNVQEEVEGLDTLILEASEYAVFETYGPLPQSVQNGWKEIMTQWIPTSGYDIDETIDIELYSDEDPFFEDLLTEIWIKLK